MENRIVIALVGVVGAGKSKVARFLASLIGAEVVEEDGMRVKLRNMGKGYEESRHMAEDEAQKIIAKCKNVIMDSDYVIKSKRKSLLKKTKKWKAKLFFVRVVCDRDVMIERLIKAPYPPNQLFKSAVVAIREMWRRTPHHYKWSPKKGGVFELKNLPFKIFGTIDTTDAKSWPNIAQSMIAKLL